MTHCPLRTTIISSCIFASLIIISLVIAVRGFSMSSFAIMGFVTFIQIIFTLCIMRALRRHILTPVKEINDAVISMARSDYETSLPKSGIVEIKNLTESFDHMRSAISAGKSRLEVEVEKAQANSEAKSDFLANMSHELRTPMNGVLGMVEMLRDTPLNDEQAQFSAQIQSSAENLLVILNDILDFSKIEANALELENIAYMLPNAITDVTNMLYPLAQEKNILLEHNLDSSIPEALLGDPGRVRQVLINLIGNAIKFTPSGSVSVQVISQTYNGDKYIRFNVIDTGVGIPADKTAAIFQKFTQADTSNTRKFGGTGLGLAITQSLVNLMGGEIGVESELGQGSTFYFTLPCHIPTEDDIAKLSSQNDPYYDAQQSDAPRLLPQDVSILLVEDDPINQEVARRLLGKIGLHNIDSAENGQDGVSMYMPELHNLILMDCQMPGMDGFEATKEIRAREEDTDNHVPIIALTANAMVGDREKCLAVGMDEYLSKPIKLDNLKALLSCWIEFDDMPATDMSHPEEAQHPDSFIPVDLNHLAMFTDGNKEQEKELFELFFETANTCMRQLEQHIGTGDESSWKAVAHRLKGSAANLGANQLSDVALIAEMHADQPEEARQLMYDDILAQYEAVQGFIEHHY